MAPIRSPSTRGISASSASAARRSWIPYRSGFPRSAPAAREAAGQWLAARPAVPAVVIAGGGGGTLRAVVEGACDGRPALPARDTIRIGGLRMGSGNVVAKRLGVPRDPLAGARHLK